MKEAEWPKCGAARLVYDSALLLEACTRHARISTYYVRQNVFGENKKHPPEVRSRGHWQGDGVGGVRQASFAKTTS